MDIRLVAFVMPQIFITNAAAVAGRAVASNRWGRIENMTVDQAASHRGRLADMAVAAGGVAARTVVAEHFLEFRMIYTPTARINRIPVTLLGEMQTAAEISGYISMALSTYFTVIFAWASIHICMGSCLICRLLATMAFDTANSSMNSFEKIFFAY
jgi:hypothetical protein